MRNVNSKNIVLWILILIPYLLLIPATAWYSYKMEKIEHASFILVNKAEMTLYHYNYKGELLQKALIATGKNSGNKAKVGDQKTPEGIFHINKIEDAASWTHDFKDDSDGPVAGAYGPYFIRLQVPGQKGIGIHGTHDNNSLGKRASEGCIRMQNADLVRLVSHISTTSIVVITPGIEDIKEDIAPPVAESPKPVAKAVIPRKKVQVKPGKEQKKLTGNLKDKNKTPIKKKNNGKKNNGQEKKRTPDSRIRH